MPVNMDPNKRKRRQGAGQNSDVQESADSTEVGRAKFGEETERDREKAIADAEWKSLWDATEVIDMDTW